MAWYGGNPYEQFMITNRLRVPMPPCTGRSFSATSWCHRSCGSARAHNVKALFAVAMVVNVGMWLERYIIVVTSLHRDFLPSAWGMYAGTVWDWALYVGTIGLFFALLFLFIRVLPMISIFEMRELVEEHR